MREGLMDDTGYDMPGCIGFEACQREAYEQGIEDTLDRYRWHDLRIDPTDLPPEDNAKYVVYSSGFMEYSTAMGWAIRDRKANADIIAWKEIEPFREVE